jgi:5-formyltetrahydrofolate cyclo-ligase
MHKAQIRKTFREKRAGLTPAQMSRLDDLLLIRFQEISLPQIDTVLSYFPHTKFNEPATHLVTDFLKFRLPQLRLCYPVTEVATSTLEAFEVNDETGWEESIFGIPEPVGGEHTEAGKIDLVLVPLVAFDERNFRVGYGKGFYDRYLARCREDVITIGLSYFEPVPAIDDIDDFDVPLNICITPNMIYER